MRLTHILLALLATAIWGFNFVVIRWGLNDLPPLLLASLRFAVAALPVLVVARPQLSWGMIVLIGSVWFVAQFAFLFTGMKVGMPPGLASVVMQSQAFVTILFAFLLLGERPTGRQIVGMVIATFGLLAIGATVTDSPDDLTLPGLLLVLAGALSWGLGNVALRKVRSDDMLALVTWLSLVPPLPFLLMSLMADGPAEVSRALSTLTWSAVASVLYLGVFATIVGFGIWGYLLRLYPVSVVSPFSMLVPVFGVTLAAIIFDEQFGFLRILAMALVLTGLAIAVLPVRWPGTRARVAADRL